MKPGAYKSESDVPLDWQVGDVLLENYEVTGIHESGGMGKVYRCHSRNWNMDLAVKSPRAEYFQTEAQKENFTHECETWIKLGLHPHIVTCFYVRQLGGIPRVFAEYIEGGSLTEWIDCGKLYGGGKAEALVRILDISIQAAIGLNVAHNKGLIHQDVKSANILITAEGCTKIADFGLANARASIESGSKTDDGSKSILCSFGGRTPAYNSPEQALGCSLTRRTDIYSWAVTVLEMFAGGIRWTDGRVAREVLVLLQEASLDSVPGFCPRMPNNVVTLLNHCLVKDEKLRPHSFSEITNSLLKMYEEIAKTPYPCSDTDLIELDSDTLNNKMLSLLEMRQIYEPPIQNAYTVLLDLLQKHPDHYLGRLNKALFHWRVTGTSSIEKLNCEVDSIFTDPYAPDMLDWRVRLEFEKLDFMRAQRLLKNCSDIQSKKVAALTCEAEILRTAFKNVLMDLFSNHQGNEAKQIAERITYADGRENVQFAFAHRRTGFVAINSRSVVNGHYSYKITGYDYRNTKVLWERTFERDISYVGISENAKLVAVASFIVEPDTFESYMANNDFVCTLAVLSGFDGKGISENMRQVENDRRSCHNDNVVYSISLDDVGSKISIWINMFDAVYELPYKLSGDRLESFRCDFRKEPKIKTGTSFKVSGDGNYLLCRAKERCSLWHYVDAKSNDNTNLCSVALDDFGLINATDHLPGFALDNGFEYAVDDLNTWELVRLLGYYRPVGNTEYLLARPNVTYELGLKEQKAKKLRQEASHDIAHNDIRNAITHLTDYLSISSKDRDEILTRRHGLVFKTGGCSLTRAWRIFSWDHYWDRQILGILPISSNGEFVVQSQASFRMASMRGEQLPFDKETRWVDLCDSGEFTIGLFRINDGRLIRLMARQDNSGYLKSGCRIELVQIGKDIKNVEYFWSHEIIWGRQDTVSNLMAVVEDAIVFETEKGQILVCSLLTGEIRRSVRCTRGSSVRFIKRVTLPSGLVLAFVAIDPFGYILVGPTGDAFSYGDLGYFEPKLRHTYDISADGLCLVGCYGEERWSLLYEKLNTGKACLIWSIAGLPVGSGWWRPPLNIRISPCGRALVFHHYDVMQVYDVGTGLCVFSWGLDGNRVIDVAFDVSSEWLVVVRDANRLEIFRLFWDPDDDSLGKTTIQCGKEGIL